MVELSKTEVIAEPPLSQKEEETSKEKVPPALEYHPLQKRWSLWFKKDSAGASSWVGGQKLVHSFQTVEDFWSLFNYIQPANQLTRGSDYSLFKEDIKPSWEDPINANGGRWILTMHKKSFDEKTNIDKYWLETVLLMIGEGFEDDVGEYVVGAVVSIRAKCNRVAVWTTTCDQEPANSIGKTFKSRLMLPPNMTISFQTHKAAQLQSSSVLRAVYTI